MASSSMDRLAEVSEDFSNTLAELKQYHSFTQEELSVIIIGFGQLIRTLRTIIDMKVAQSKSKKED